MTLIEMLYCLGSTIAIGAIIWALGLWECPIILHPDFHTGNLLPDKNNEGGSMKLLLDYDASSDVLYISIGEPVPSLSYDTDTGILIRRGIVTKKLTGATIMDYTKIRRDPKFLEKLMQGPEVKQGMDEFDAMLAAGQITIEVEPVQFTKQEIDIAMGKTSLTANGTK